MNAKEKMLAGLPFDTHDADLGREREKATRLLQKLNTITLFDGAYREILRELLPNTTTECLIRPPFFCDYGYNIYIGEGGFINFNCVMLDGAPIRIGNNVLIGPAVQIYTFHHPIDHLERREVEICRPVTIGDDCWIGGGAIILPGVTIGPKSVIGAGAVVTKDVPEGGVVAGNPARPITSALLTSGIFFPGIADRSRKITPPETMNPDESGTQACRPVKNKAQRFLETAPIFIGTS